MLGPPAVTKYLADHHWVASTEELYALGISRDVLSRARRRGVLVAPVRGVVALAGVELTFEGRARLALLAATGKSFVSGPSAGALYGLRRMPRSFVEITVEQQRRISLPPGSRLVFTSWIDDRRDVRTRSDGLRIASPLRMLFGLAAQLNQFAFERAAEDAWHLGLVTPEQADDFLYDNRRSGRSGVTRMERWLWHALERPRPSQSDLELDVAGLIERADLPAPVRQHPLVLPGGETIHLDLAWPDVRLAVEPGHSWWHGGDLRQRADQARDRACASVGWLVVRFDETVGRDQDAAVAELRAIYRRRRQELAGAGS